MSYESNKWLEKYEIKGPDFDPVERPYIGMGDVRYEPARFEKRGDTWVQKKTDRRRGKKAMIMVSGDITCFERQMYEAQKGDDYDFRYAFEKVAPIFAQADLVIGNLETMLSPSAPYRFEQYVCEQDFACNAPCEFLDGVRSAGFDVLTNANNHDLDVGAVGIGETIDNVERFGFIHTGTFKTDKKRYEMIEVNGMKVAVVAFSANGQNGKDCNLTKEGAIFLLHDYNREKAAEIIRDARKNGADFVIAFPHWGKENAGTPNKDQKTMAKEMAELGYDCIVGSHTHVLQPFTFVRANGKDVPVFYSMGNFISHNVDNKKSRTIIACIEISAEGGRRSLTCSYIPMFTSEYCGDRKYVVVPIAENTKSSRNQRRLTRIKNEVGDEIEINDTVKYKGFMEKRSPLPAKAETNEPDPSKIKSFPYIFDTGKFVYELYKDHAEIVKITDDRPQVSYTTDTDIIDLPVTKIKAGAFQKHQVMRKIKFTDNITNIEDGVCKGCAELEGFRLSNLTTRIGREAFADCPRLKCVVLKSNLKCVEEHAFLNCTNLRSVKIPLGVEGIADNAFEGCTKAVFYAERDSYGWNWARAHGFEVRHMELFVGKGMF